MTAFADGYALHGPLPLPPAVRAAYRAATELHLPDRLLFEVGLVEGRRQALHKRRVRQQAAHATAVLTATATFRRSINAHALVRHLLPYTAGGRQEVRAAAVDELTRQARMTDGLTVAWQQTNADAYLAATGWGIAEAANSPAEGGPPNPTDVQRDAEAAAAGAAGALAWSRANDWTAEQTGGLAGDLTRSIGPGPDVPAADGSIRTLDEVVAAARAALDKAVGIGFYAEEQSAQQMGLGFLLYLDTPGVLIDFVTMGDPRVEAVCEGYANNGPYLPGDVPGIPVHGLCRCWYEKHYEATALAA